MEMEIKPGVVLFIVMISRLCNANYLQVAIMKLLIKN